jgi:hypothetical protein
MKKLVIYLIVLLAATACRQPVKTTKSEKTKVVVPARSATQYTCPMHPDVLSNKPGVCPKCGMDLVEKE